MIYYLSIIMVITYAFFEYLFLILCFSNILYKYANKHIFML